MGYKVIFLDGLDGRPFVQCEVCKKIKRNVIEPIAIFVKEEDFERIDKQLKNLPKNKVDEVVGKLIKETNKLLAQSEARCIFHCEKENEVWIENIEEYQKYQQRQKKAIAKEQPFNEDSPAKWRENLVDTFWERIRAYRFAVDYADELTDEARKILEENEEIKKNKDLLKFYLEKCKEKKCYDFSRVNFLFFSDKEKKYHDFKQIIFPYFQKEINFNWRDLKNIEVFEEKKENKTEYYLKYLKNLNFWYKNEIKNFKAKTNFSKIQFSGEANFFRTQFLGRADFWEAQFLGEVSFKEAQFSGEVSFSRVQFSSGVNFYSTQFSCRVFFGGAQFSDRTHFSRTQFSGEANFYRSQFSGEANFFRAQFENRIYFFFEGVNKQIDFSFIQCNPDVHIEIRNLKTERLIINNFTNYAKELLFFDLELLLSEKNDEPNLEIKNSILNKMRFINCDFSKGKKIKIEDSSIASCEFVNVKWGKISEERICPELFENKPSKAQDIYRQLKLAHDNQKDFIHGGDFYALEMRAYDKYLDSLSWLGNFKDKIIFKISKFASNFAQDWLKPVVWIVTITLYLSLFTLFDIGYSQKLSDFNIQEFIAYMPTVFVLLFYFFLTGVFYEKIGKYSFYKDINLIFSIFSFTSLVFILGVVADKNISEFVYVLSKGFDLFFTSLAKLFVPWRTLTNSDSVKVPFYKTVYGLGSIAVSYLAYQLIVSLRRKIRR